MAKIVPFIRKKVYTGDLTGLLQEAVHAAKEEVGREEKEIFRLQVSFSKLLQSNMARTLLDEKRISPGLFLCSAYAAKVFEGFASSVPSSFYATDYLIRGYDEKNPRFFQEGADVCFLICVFFEHRNRWRAMRPKDFHKMGTQLYLTYYQEAKKEIGWHMAKNFADIVGVARRSINRN